MFVLLKKLALLGVLWQALASQAQDSQLDDWMRNPAMGNYKAYAEFKMAHYDAARHIWEALAGLGNADALFNLAVLAEDGLGEPKAMKVAEALYVAAANAGGFKAQYRLGMLYSTGGALDKDLVKARQYLNLAADHGDKDAVAKLATLGQPGPAGSLFEEAEILSSSGQHARAAVLYERGSDAGDMRARTRLAWMYEAGRGVPRDLDHAAGLFLTAAQAGIAEAQFAMAVMCRTGRGQPRDRAQALVWLKQSAAHGYPAAVAALKAELNNQ